MTAAFRWIQALLICASPFGCTNINTPLNPIDTPVGQRQVNRTRAAVIRVNDAAPAGKHEGAGDGWFVGLAISGGGSRSANFSAAVMFELQRLNLLQKVDAVSSVSGGSLTAAYYCVADDAQWNPGNLQRLLTHSFASDIVWTMAQPWYAFALAMTDFDRSDVLAQSFTRTLFTLGGKRLTFADLRPDRPRLLINATDLQSGKRFIFSNESFDKINSDLAAFPLGHAVAASSSVPVLLHHVTLRDYSTIFKQYRHLVDGGVEDNLGVLSLLETYKSNNDLALLNNQPAPYPKGAILLVLDSGTHFNAQLGDKGDVGLLEGLGTGAKLSSAKLIARASSATLADLIVQYAPDTMTADDIRKLLGNLARDGYIITTDRDNRPLTIVHIALSQAASLKDLPFQSFYESLDNIETYFNISDVDAHHLYKAAELIVREKFEPKLKQLEQQLRKTDGNGAAARQGD